MPGRRWHIDFETRSRVSIKEAGMFRYVEDISTKPILLAFAADDDKPTLVDLDLWDYKSRLAPLFEGINRGDIVCAHNAQFERLVWTLLCDFPVSIKPRQWSCTAARARVIGLPGKLEVLARVMGVSEQKDKRGDHLIRKFCNPNRKGEFTQPAEAPDDWFAFGDYCIQDVNTERALDKVLPELSDVEFQAWLADYDINMRGLPVDMEAVNNAIGFVERQTERLEEECVRISGCKPSQIDQTRSFLASRGLKTNDLTAATVERLAAKPGLPGDLSALLHNRIELSRAGTKKLNRIRTCVSTDSRIRGAFLFSSASTRRWSSTNFQFHNLQKPDKGIEPHRVLEMMHEEPDLLEYWYDKPLSALAQSIRGFIASNDTFRVLDYSAIEPRGLAWMSNERWMIEAFASGADVYKEMSSRVYKKKISEIDDYLRFIGKQLVLGCGYAMGAAKFQLSCARFGTDIPLEQCENAIKLYRSSVPNIQNFWWACERAALRAIETGKRIYLEDVWQPSWGNNKPTAKCPKDFSFYGKMIGDMPILFVDMPSGTIAYPEPEIRSEDYFGRPKNNIYYKTSLGTAWVERQATPGLITENLCQALTRDILRDGILGAEKAGFKIIGHCHDEAFDEGRENKNDLKDLEYHLCNSSPWAKGLPIKMEGYMAQRYKK